MFKKSIAALMAVSLCFAGMATPVSSNLSTITPICASAAYENGRLYNQWDSQWANVHFTKYSTDPSQNNMKVSACGVFAFCNAIYALNYTYADAKAVATWGVNDGGYRPGAGGTYRDIFFSHVQAAYGDAYKFTMDGMYSGKVTDSRFINHLSSGGVAVVHVYGHFIAITGYRNGQYHVIDSAVTSGRGLAADGWVSASKLQSGTTNVDWYALLSNKPSGNENQNCPYTKRFESGTKLYAAPGSSQVTTTLTSANVYTIVEEQTVNGVKYGKFKSGAGWAILSENLNWGPVATNYTKRFEKGTKLYTAAGSSEVKTTLSEGSVFTIVQEQMVNGVKYGMFKSGAGWAIL